MGETAVAILHDILIQTLSRSKPLEVVANEVTTVPLHLCGARLWRTNRCGNREIGPPQLQNGGVP
jgi:hypothetical protein